MEGIDEKKNNKIANYVSKLAFEQGHIKPFIHQLALLGISPQIIRLVVAGALASVSTMIYRGALEIPKQEPSVILPGAHDASLN